MELAAKDGVAIRFYKALRFFILQQASQTVVTWNVEEIHGQLVSRKNLASSSLVSVRTLTLVSRAIVNSRTFFVVSVE